MPEGILVIACGALAREIRSLKCLYGWTHLRLKCLDARLHNRPELIADRLRQAIRRHRAADEQVFVAFADCGTGGAIDAVLAEEGVERLPGAHCYQFYAGTERFASLAESTPGTFYVTDFLAKHFERLVVRPLKFDQYPALRDAYFGNYHQLVYLSQTHDPALQRAAEAAAKQLKLKYRRVHCGYGELEQSLRSRIQETAHGQMHAHILA